jgi:hypothetical protein
MTFDPVCTLDSVYLEAIDSTKQRSDSTAHAYRVLCDVINVCSNAEVFVSQKVIGLFLVTSLLDKNGVYVCGWWHV